MCMSCGELADGMPLAPMGLARQQVLDVSLPAWISCADIELQRCTS